MTKAAKTATSNTISTPSSSMAMNNFQDFNNSFLRKSINDFDLYQPFSRNIATFKERLSSLFRGSYFKSEQSSNLASMNVEQSTSSSQPTHIRKFSVDNFIHMDEAYLLQFN